MKGSSHLKIQNNRPYEIHTNLNFLNTFALYYFIRALLWCEYMKSVVKPHLLLPFFVASAIYTYANFYDIDLVRYWSKPFMMPLLAMYYVLSVKIIDIKYVVALAFAFGGDLLFLSLKESFLILGIGCFLLFILINMVIVAGRIGAIKLDKFYLTILPFILISMGIISVFFRDVGLMKLLFMIYASVLGLHGAFALYWYLKEKKVWVLLYLTGVIFFFLAAIGKGLEAVEGPKDFYKIANMIAYILAMTSICLTYVHHINNNNTNPHQNKGTKTLL